MFYKVLPIAGNLSNMLSKVSSDKGIVTLTKKNHIFKTS